MQGQKLKKDDEILIQLNAPLPPIVQDFMSPIKINPTNAARKGKAKGKTICVVGDLRPLEKIYAYKTPSLQTEGKGFLTISLNEQDHVSSTVAIGKKKVLVSGNGVPFTVKFLVVAPATNPAIPMADTVIQYQGTGQFLAKPDSNHITDI